MSAFNTSAIFTRPLADGDSFDGTEINDAFDEFSEIMLGDVEAGAGLNITSTNFITWEKFHQGALTQSWSAGSSRPATFLSIIDEPGPPAVSTWGDNQNKYSVDDTGIDFELHTGAAAVMVDCTVNLLKCRDTWNSHPRGWGQGWTLSFRGFGNRSATFSFAQRAVKDEQVGFPMRLTQTLTNVSAGKHRIYAEIQAVNDFDHGAYSGNYPEVSQWISTARHMSVLAIYR